MISATEAVKILREHGIRMSVSRLIHGIEAGYYSFGRVVSTGTTGRRTVEIYKRKFEEWMEDVL